MSVEVVEVPGVEVVVMDDVRLEIVEAAIQGPPGPPGANGAPGSGGVQILSLIAARDISGHRAVVATVDGADYADPATPAHADAFLGITTGAALGGDVVTLQAAGEMVEPSWAWTPGTPIYAGTDGILTHTPPAAGWVQIVATAVAPTRILLTGRQAITLA